MKEPRSTSNAGSKKRAIRFDRSKTTHLDALAVIARRGLVNLCGTRGVINALHDEFGIIADRDVALEVMRMAVQRLPECGEPVEGTREQWDDDEVARALFFTAGLTVAEIAADVARLWGGYNWRPLAQDTDEVGKEVDDNISIVDRELTRARHLLHLAYSAGEDCEEEPIYPRLFVTGENGEMLLPRPDEEPFEF